MGSRAARERRAVAGVTCASLHAGVAHRQDLRALGPSRHDVASEVAAGRWVRVGRHTVSVGSGPLTAEAQLWRAVWESGAGAVLDGAAALLASGLTGYRPEIVDISLPSGNRHHQVAGVRLHRRREVGPVWGAGVPRTKTEVATIRAAQWARTDRQAALLICLVVQQRLLPPARLLAYWKAMRYSPRRRLIDNVVRDVCDGAHSLGELDFAAWCRSHGLPRPSRQVVRQLPTGRVYLDVAWNDADLVVEIDRGHHGLALNPVDDALRQNEVTIAARYVLRIPVVGLRLSPDAFMDQVVRAHQLRTAGTA